VHVGKGATVGSVVAMRGAVAPAAVGVDIGCGMAAVKTSLVADDMPDNLRKIRLAIEEAVPVGRAYHHAPAWEEASEGQKQCAQGSLERFKTLDPSVRSLFGRAGLQLGTLGGGNHFIEVCLDTEDAVWLMLHSGSRHIGAALAEHHMGAARRLFHNR